MFYPGYPWFRLVLAYRLPCSSWLVLLKRTVWVALFTCTHRLRSAASGIGGSRAVCAVADDDARWAATLVSNCDIHDSDLTGLGVDATGGLTVTGSIGKKGAQGIVVFAR